MQTWSTVYIVPTAVQHRKQSTQVLQKPAGVAGGGALGEALTAQRLGTLQQTA